MEDSVRQRAAAFEALIRSQLDLSFARCSSSPRSRSGSTIELSHLTSSLSRGSSSDVATPSREGSRTASPISRMSSRRADEAFSALIAETSRLISNQTSGPASSSDTTSQQAQIAAALADRLAEIAHALSCKEDEVENLQAVMKELAETRSDAMRLKVQCLESYNKLQTDYTRVIKAAQLAQQTARHNLSKALSTRNSLRDAQDALHRERAEGASLRAVNAQLQRQNEELTMRVAVLEAAASARVGPMSDCRHHSACSQAYMEAVILRNVGLY